MILLEQLKNVRNFSVQLCEPLETEDYVVQTLGDVSPIKWHLGHTTWFYEEFILKKFIKNYTPYNKQYGYLFNSYYNSVGDRTPKPNRGCLSRPTVKEVLAYRAHVNDYMYSFFGTNVFLENEKDVCSLFTIGIHHEQQHQELMMYDIKHILYVNSQNIYYQNPTKFYTAESFSQTFTEIDEGIYSIGKSRDANFGFDNEYPQHKYYLKSFSISDKLATNQEYLEFIEDKAYTNPLLWLSDGWDFIQQYKIHAPMYWKKIDDMNWNEWTFYGWQPLDLSAPVSHVSYYEAEAFARWKKCRLPSEMEWEVFAQKNSETSTENFIDSINLLPYQKDSKYQIRGYLWEWTSSPYTPYPNYKQPNGAIGEYNSKFMINQMVLRGGSYATTKSHYRNTYRNFFQPEKRWLFNGIRLVEERW